MTDLRFRGDLNDPACPTRVVLDHVTGRWGGLVLAALADGPQRYSQLRRTIGGVSEKMLAQTLRLLERDGLLTRTVRPTTPIAVEYELTALGEGLVRPLRTLLDWIELHVGDLVEAQEGYDARAAATSR